MRHLVHSVLSVNLCQNEHISLVSLQKPVGFLGQLQGVSLFSMKDHASSSSEPPSSCSDLLAASCQCKPIFSLNNYSTSNLHEWQQIDWMFGKSLSSQRMPLLLGQSSKVLLFFCKLHCVRMICLWPPLPPRRSHYWGRSHSSERPDRRSAQVQFISFVIFRN